MLLAVAMLVVLLAVMLWITHDLTAHDAVIHDLLSQVERHYLISSSMTSSYYRKLSELSTRAGARTSSFSDGYAKGRESVADEDRREDWGV